MKTEKLNHSKFKILLYTLILGVILIFIIVFQTSRASYRTTQSINIAHGTINYKMPDLNIVAIKVQQEEDNTDEDNYNSVTDIPIGDYVLNEDKSYCFYKENDAEHKVNSTMSYDNTTGKVNINIDITKKGTKCYLYFDIEPSVTLAGIKIPLSSILEGNYSVTGVETGNKGLLKVEEDGTMYSGTTYYYRGAVNNNWVKFAGMYWRIIRFNGDGSIRMIYSGTTAPTSSESIVMTGEGTQIGKSAFNSSYNDNMYVGWKYTSGQVHGTGTSSTIRDYLVGSNGTSGWYSSSGLSSYASYIADGKFCNDRYPSTSSTSSNGSGGTDSTDTWYAPFIRLFGTKTASFGCQTSSDIFTEKVGLITSDEVMMAGGFSSNNSSYYLYTGQGYWAMSPGVFDYNRNYWIGYARESYVRPGGWLDVVQVDGPYAVRPVINLKAGIKFKGSGTYDDVYEIAS